MTMQSGTAETQHAIRNALQMMIAIDRQLDRALKLLDQGATQDCEAILEGLKTAMPQGVDTLSDHLETKG